MSPAFGRDAGERVEREDLDVGVVVAPGTRRGSRRAGRSAPATPSAASIAASRHSPSAACSPPPAARCHAVAASSAVARLCVSPERAEHAPEMHPGERGQAHVTGGLGLVDRELQGGGTGLVVAGLALRASETRDLVRLGLQEAEPSRRLRGTTDVDDGIVEPVLDAGQLAEHRVAADVQPRVVDRRQPVLDLVARLDAALLVAG